MNSKDIEVQEKKKKVVLLCFHPQQNGTFISYCVMNQMMNLQRCCYKALLFWGRSEGFQICYLEKMNTYEHWKRVTRFNR